MILFMPTKNRTKVYIVDTYYHLYSRGWNRTPIFQNDEDYKHFEFILARHLSPEPITDRKGREYHHLRNELDLVAYCLMPNHFHILIYQREDRAIAELMSSVLTGYTMYFNRKYRRRGSLFESTYKAVPILEDNQPMHITRYIHLNHAQYKTWPYSSYGDCLDEWRKWIDPRSILELFNVEPAGFEPLRFRIPDYYCTPLDAEKAGLSASSDRYVFPELDKAKLKNY